VFFFLFFFYRKGFQLATEHSGNADALEKKRQRDSD